MKHIKASIAPRSDMERARSMSDELKELLSKDLEGAAKMLDQALNRIQSGMIHTAIKALDDDLDSVRDALAEGDFDL